MLGYTFLEHIGSGDRGEVFRARDTRRGRTVAVRVLPENLNKDGDCRNRLLREARAVSALSHPNIATLFEFGEEDGQILLVFEFVPGQTLRRLTGGQPLPVQHAVALAAQIADALAEAHAGGITHRDLNPDNVFVTPKGQVKVVDFGLAAWTRRDEEAAARHSRVQLEMVAGTGDDASRERINDDQADERRDILSFGAVLYEMLTGRVPFSGRRTAGRSVAVDETAPLHLGRLNPAVPQAVEAIVLRALASRDEGEFSGAAGLAADLREASASLEVSRSRAPALRRRPDGRSRRLPVMIILILVVVVGLGWWFGESVRSIVKWFADSVSVP